MNSIDLSTIATPSGAMTIAKATLFAGVLVAFAPAVALGDPAIEKKGTTPYVTHFHFSAVDEHRRRRAR